MKFNFTHTKAIFFAAGWLLSSSTFASYVLDWPVVSQLRQGKTVIQLGGFTASQGKAQNVYIQDLIGDHFSVSNHNNQNVLLGLGYLFDGDHFNQVDLMYGINAFYFFHTTVSGTIKQEQLFNNLSYNYNVTNLPVYATGKALFKTRSEQFNVALDLGVGPNFMTTSNFREHSLDGGITLPDRAFSGNTSATFSAMAGVALKMNNVLGRVPLECGYRIFYLGSSNFNVENSQILTALTTGDSYAQALTCGIMV